MNYRVILLALVLFGVAVYVLLPEQHMVEKKATIETLKELQPKTSKESEVDPTQYPIAFQDDFNAFKLDTEIKDNANWVPYFVKWGVRHLKDNEDEALKADVTFTGEGGRPLGLPLHQQTGNGTLILSGYKIPEHHRLEYYGFPYTGGMISTERSFSQLYGYWEVKARFLSVSQGHHWAIWLLPQDGTWPPEIDMAEVVGNTPDKFYVNAHGSPRENELVEFEAPHGATGWHTFGFWWTPETMTWLVDGETVKQIDNYIDQPMYLVVSPEIGGKWPGKPDKTTIWPTQLEIDYVKVHEYQLPQKKNASQK